MSSLRELWEQATAADQRVGDFVAAQEAAANEQPLVAVRRKMQDMLFLFSCHFKDFLFRHKTCNCLT